MILQYESTPLSPTPPLAAAICFCTARTQSSRGYPIPAIALGLIGLEAHSSELDPLM